MKGKKKVLSGMEGCWKYQIKSNFFAQTYHIYMLEVEKQQEVVRCKF